MIKVPENQIISTIPSAKVLEEQGHKFQLTIGTLSKRLLTLPFALVCSKKYLRQFLAFCSTFQRDGSFVNFAGQECQFNSMALYYHDLATKNMSTFATKLDETVPMQELTIKNAHKQDLSCLIVPRKGSSKWVIGLHGWTENKFLALRLVDHFWHEGYNILTFDAKGHGLSYGELTDVGFQSAADINDVVLFLQANYQLTELGLIGNSMGGASVCYFVGRYGSCYPELKWAISDCAFADLKMQMRYVMQYRYQKPWWLISLGLPKMIGKNLAINFKKYNIGRNFKHCPNIPILFSHGTSDTFVPVFMSKKLYQEKIKFEPEKPISARYLPEKIEHVRIIADCNQAYRKVIKDFISKQVENEK